MFCLDVLAFDAAITCHAQGLVELMIMSMTIRMIAMNVKIGGTKRFLASHARETTLVISTSDATVGRTDRLTHN